MIKIRFIRPQELFRDVKPSLSTPLMFGPGVFLLCLGLAAILAPALLLGIVAGFCIFLGIVATVLAYRFLRFKRTLEGALRDLQTRVTVHPVQPEVWQEEERVETKKVILH